MTVEAIIFDMDGVLIDSERFYQERRTRFLATLGLRYQPADYPRVVGQTFAQMWQTLAIPTELTAEIDAGYREYCQKEPLLYQQLMRPEVPHLLASLKQQGKKLAIASSSSRVNINRMLNECAIAEEVDLIVSGEEFRATKPHPEIYLETLRRLKLPAEACLVIEDSWVGIEAARSAGLEVWALKDPILQPDQRRAQRQIENLRILLDEGNGLLPSRDLKIL